MNTTSSSQVKHVDVLILGGGPAGTAAGIALLKRDDLSVCMVERGDYSEYKFGESLSSGVRSTLEYLGVWGEFSRTQSFAPFSSQTTWGSQAQRQLGYMFTPQGMGWALDRLSFEQMMASHFVERGGDLLTNSQVITCERLNDGGWHVGVRAENQESMTIICKYIVDASGRRGVMRTNLNLALSVYDRLIGIASTGYLADNIEEPFEHQVEACEYGWWYTAPMPDNRVSVVLMTDPDIANQMQLTQPEVWQAMLEKMPHLSKKMEHVYFTDKPRSFPCYSSYLREAGGDDWVAVGDAAASYDPISSSGIPRALASGIQGACIAVDSLFGNGDLLMNYSRLVEQDFHQYLNAQWQYYQRESRWAKSLFWARRRAVIAVSKNAVIRESYFYDHKSAPAPIHLKVNEVQELWMLCEQGKTVEHIAQSFLSRHSYLPEQKVLLGLQELIEHGYIALEGDDGDDVRMVSGSEYFDFELKYS